MELESGILEHCNTKMLTSWPAARLCDSMLGSSRCMLNRSRRVRVAHTHTHRRLAELWMSAKHIPWSYHCVRIALHNSAWLRECVFQRQWQYVYCISSESCFKHRQQSLQPSQTIPHTPHAACYSLYMTNGICLTQCAVSLDALLRLTHPTLIPGVIPVIIAPFGVGAEVQLQIFIFIMSFLPWQAADDTALGCGDAGIIQTSSKIPHFSRVVTIANSAAMSFLAR